MEEGVNGLPGVLFDANPERGLDLLLLRTGEAHEDVVWINSPLVDAERIGMTSELRVGDTVS